MAIKDWSTTAASNVNSLTAVGLGFDENQAPRLVNDTAREAMAQIAAFVADAYAGLCPYYAGGGSANAHTITVDPAISAYVAGQMFVIKWGASNTGATTLNANSLGTKAVQYCGVALKGGEIVSGRIGIVVYDGTQFELLTPFVLNVQDTTNKHLGIGSGVFANGTGGTTEPNIAVGQGAGAALTTGYGHTLVGVDAGKSITSAQGNTAVGHFALDANQTGQQNTALGNSALGNATGDTNTGVGRSAGLTVTSGSYNTLVGYTANVSAATKVGGTAVGAAAVAGTSAIALGRGASAGDNKLALGSASYSLDTQTTVGSAGAASALPANPTGYLEVVLNGTAVVIPYYAKS
jgi:hypothetical protein